ncbi:aldo/keto reductase [Saccharopolyspora erythraea]|uniref:Aldo/keto reductase n=2 Tax=Saccharopolyspora erythraea TaxID=1836 RepID=A4F969_SACEN|nr:aldo/keto reductase [Saccharopolyspora erythraea]EQD87164.1 aldo/keto reductase [Saccharopolyspora erythraea D]QRK91153.1 aldo/keto reductase [Saccharopolyspora erythraea]CAM00594.1 aldo/keto reductase [Saccharopolyspora erythraea NRRL 2338]
MQRRTLGRTGISVSKYALGTMMLGQWGNADHDDAVRLVHTALDAGVNLVDTADMYSHGESERIVGKALRGRRDDVVLATKGFFPMGEDPNRGGGSRRWITRAVEDSLRRLGTDRIDLYQIHRPDPATDIDETLSVLSDLVRAGKIMAIGSSDFPAEQIVEARWVAQRRNHIAFHTEQPPYSVFVRGIERSVLPTARKYGMGVLTWSPLNSGWLTGRYRRGTEIELNEFRRLIAHKFDLDLAGNQRKLDAVEELLALADAAGVSLTHLALAFAASHAAVTSVILGPRTVEQLHDVLGAAEVALDDEVLDRIDEIVAPGTDLNPADIDYAPPHMTSAGLRRRPPAER